MYILKLSCNSDLDKTPVHKSFYNGNFDRNGIPMQMLVWQVLSVVEWLLLEPKVRYGNLVFPE